MKKLNLILAETASKKRPVDAWIAELKQAEREAAGEPKAKWFLYHVNCRIGSEGSASKGKDGTRRSNLTELLESLEPLETHVSTSTWMIKVHIPKADTLAGLLSPPLDPSHDGLHVTHVSATNRARFGNTGLKP